VVILLPHIDMFLGDTQVKKSLLVKWRRASQDPMARRQSQINSN